MQENIKIPNSFDTIVGNTVIIKDTLPAVMLDSLAGKEISGSEKQDTTPIIEKPKIRNQSLQVIPQNTRTEKSVREQSKNESSEEIVSNQNPKHPKNELLGENFTLFPKGEQQITPKPQTIWERSESVKVDKELTFSVNQLNLTSLDWTLFIGVLSMLLLIYLKTFYQKLVTKVMNTMVNFQLADTMLREKNSIVKRAFFIMNLNFILVFSLFILLIAKLYGISYYEDSLKDYFLISSVLTIVIVCRILLFYGIAYIFEWFPAVLAQLHTGFLINKNLGIFLLPIVFIAIYSDPIVSKTVIFSGIGIVLIATIFRLIRGFQIIIKNGVLLFYAILYLCTLELLPIVLGSKLFILLR